MDIFAYIKRDHRKLAAMMDDLITIRMPIVRQTAYQQVKTELSLHTVSEEQTFCRAIDATGSDVLSRQMVRSVREHHELTDLLTVLDTTPIASEFWLAKFAELHQAVKTHVAEEEDDIFPKARALFSPGQAKQLALDMEAMKDTEAMKEAQLSDIEFDIPAL